MPDVELCDFIRTYLVNQSIVRDPRTAGSDPPLWRNPRNGAPAPSEKKGVENDDALVISVFDVGGVAPERAFEKVYRFEVVDLWFRSEKYPTWKPVEKAIRAALHDKRNWDMAGLTVIESLLWRGPNPLGADEQAFTYTVGYLFQVYAT